MKNTIKPQHIDLLKYKFKPLSYPDPDPLHSRLQLPLIVEPVQPGRGGLGHELGLEVLVHIPILRDVVSELVQNVVLLVQVRYSVFRAERER